ncbi:hypothetical protein AKJ16_DCAP02249 [Drosera capensis]
MIILDRRRISYSSTFPALNSSSILRHACASCFSSASSFAVSSIFSLENSSIFSPINHEQIISSTYYGRSNLPRTIDHSPFWQDFLPLHTLLSAESTDHYCNVDTFTSFNKIRGGNNTCSTRQTLVQGMQDIAERKGGIDQLHLDANQVLCNSLNVKQMQDYRLIWTKHYPSGNHRNQRVSYLSCRLHKKLQLCYSSEDILNLDDVFSYDF